MPAELSMFCFNQSEKWVKILWMNRKWSGFSDIRSKVVSTFIFFGEIKKWRNRKSKSGHRKKWTLVSDSGADFYLTKDQKKNFH